MFDFMMFGKSCKAFFGISLATIMILSGFSFSGNLVPEADATVYKYLYGTSVQTSTYDYLIYVHTWVDPGYYGYRVVQCLDGDKIVNGFVSSYYTSGYGVIYDTSKYFGQDPSGTIYLRAVGTNVYNDQSYRTYFTTYVYCSYS